MTSERIMVIKHGALGDMVQAIDGFASIRAGHPDAHVTLLTTAPFAGLARAMPFFDAVEVDRRARPWHLKDLLALRRLFRSGLRRVYDFQSSKRTQRYFRHLIPAEVEFVGVWKGASHVLPNMTGINNRDRMVKTAERGGCPAMVAAVDWLDGGSGDWPSKAAVLIPGCSPAKPAKRWPAEGFIALAKALQSAGLTPVLAGTGVDRDAGDVIMKAVPDAVDLIGRTSLMELASLLKSAQLVVGNDTGPVFLGARLGAPTVMVMSVHTDPSMSAPHGLRAGWLKRDDIAAISAEMVMDEANRLMG